MKTFLLGTSFLRLVILYQKEQWLQAYLYLDMKTFINDGNELWITTNNVIGSRVDVPLRYLSVGSRPTL
jgi:hypothetical protein